MQQQAVPAYAPPPADAALQQRIDTLVSYAAKNGMAFVHMMGERQGANPEYAFLRGGEGAPYFAWALHCALSGRPAGAAAQPAAPPHAASAPQYAAPPQAAGAPTPQQQQQHQPAAAAQQPGAQSTTAGVLADLPAEVSSGWGQVLGLLSGSRDSIRNSQAWFIACAPYAAGMAEMMLQHIESLEGHHDRQLHVIYLANDILFKALSQRPPGSGPEADGIAQAFLPRLGRMLRRTFLSGGQTAEVQSNLLRVVNFWAERGVFSHLDVESLTMEMMGVSAPAAGAAGTAGAAAANVQAPAAPPQQQQQQQPGAPVDLAAAARAAAAAINRKVGHVDGATPAGGATSGRRKWDAAPPDVAAAGPAAPAASAAPAAASQWAQQAQQVLQQMQAPQQAGQPFAAAAYPAPPSAASYWASGAMPGYDQQAAQAYGPPPGGFYPRPGAYGQQPGAYPPPPGQQPGAYPPPPHGQQPGAYPPPPSQHQGAYPPPPGQQPGAYPPPPGQPGQQYPGHPGAQPPYGQPPAGFYPPPGAPPGAYPPPPGPGAVGFYPPPPPEAQPPPPEEEPFDCMSFPPGLLPKLVEESLRTDPPYSPLSIFDIEQTGVPPPPKMDAYLKSRVAKFYAQLADYRPGMLYSDIETGDARHKHFSDRDGVGAGSAPALGPPLPPPGPELPHAGLGLAQPPVGMGLGFGVGSNPGLGLGAAPVDDGSFAGTSRGGTGLGFTRPERRDSGPHPAAGGEAGGGMAGAASTALGEAGPELVGRPGDVFSSYRYMRSKGYHQMIIDNAAKKFGRGN